jgi:hypothetical protein
VRTTDFSTVLFDAVNLCGYDLSNITEQQFRTVRQFANQRLRIAWESFPWFSLTRFAEVAVVVNATTGLRTVAVPTLSGEVVGVYSQNPLTTTQAVYVSYALTEINNVETIIVNTPITKVWVEYRIKRPEMFGDVWSASVTYRAGAQVYFDSSSGLGTLMPVAGYAHTANFYTTSTTLPIGTKPVFVGGGDARWVKVSIPYMFASYISRAVYADFLRSEQQYEDAGKADIDASAVLEQEYDKELRQQGQIRRINFIDTY